MSSVGSLEDIIGQPVELAHNRFVSKSVDTFVLVGSSATVWLDLKSHGSSNWHFIFAFQTVLQIHLNHQIIQPVINLSRVLTSLN